MCMYVCLYICIHSYIHVCIYILYMHTSAWGVVPPISRVSVSVCVCVCARANDVRVNTCIYPCHRPPPGLGLVHIFWEFDRGPLGAILSGSRQRPRTGCCQKGRFFAATPWNRGRVVWNRLHRLAVRAAGIALVGEAAWNGSRCTQQPPAASEGSCLSRRTRQHSL